MAAHALLDDELEALAARLGELLKQHGWTLTLAESCTGGWLAQTVTAIAGSSLWFDRGFVSYSNAAKMEMLDVSEHTLRTYGAVSQKTAEEMALGALRHSHATLSASITGIAGPDGGTAEKPVGTVCFAWSSKAGAIHSSRRQFAGNRSEVRRQSVKTALEGLLQLTLTTDL